MTFNLLLCEANSFSLAPKELCHLTADPRRIRKQSSERARRAPSPRRFRSQDGKRSKERSTSQAFMRQSGELCQGIFFSLKRTSGDSFLFAGDSRIYRRCEIKEFISPSFLFERISLVHRGNGTTNDEKWWNLFFRQNRNFSSDQFFQDSRPPKPQKKGVLEKTFLLSPLRW